MGGTETRPDPHSSHRQERWLSCSCARESKLIGPSSRCCADAKAQSDPCLRTGDAAGSVDSRERGGDSSRANVVAEVNCAANTPGPGHISRHLAGSQHRACLHRLPSGQGHLATGRNGGWLRATARGSCRDRAAWPRIRIVITFNMRPEHDKALEPDKLSVLRREIQVGLEGTAAVTSRERPLATSQTK
jgi:hypothetical protein